MIVDMIVRFASFEAIAEGLIWFTMIGLPKDGWWTAYRLERSLLLVAHCFVRSVEFFIFAVEAD